MTLLHSDCATPTDCTKY